MPPRAAQDRQRAGNVQSSLKDPLNPTGGKQRAASGNDAGTRLTLTERQNSGDTSQRQLPSKSVGQRSSVGRVAPSG